MERAASGYQMPDTASCIPRSDGLDEQRSRRRGRLKELHEVTALLQQQLVYNG